MHSINQVLQPMRCPLEEDLVSGDSRHCLDRYQRGQLSSSLALARPATNAMHGDAAIRVTPFFSSAVQCRLCTLLSDTLYQVYRVFSTIFFWCENHLQPL